MKKLILTSIYFLISLAILAQISPQATEVWKPEPQVITAGKTDADPPSDAIILFNGKDLSKWLDTSGKVTAKWKLENDAMTVVKGEGEIYTQQKFGDCQLHIEWRTPSEVKGESQGRGNSGIFLMSRYEVQVLDNYNNKTYVNGQAGSIYKQHIPLVNVCKPPGEWQTFDIIFTAPRFSDNGRVMIPARVTVIQNGVLVQNNVTIWGTTTDQGWPRYEKHEAKESLRLQDHDNPVSYRNIWIREL